MSVMSKHALVCPKCGNKQTATVWDSINVTVDPVLRDELFSGKINTLTCSKCDKKTVINIPLMYQDMERRICAQYYPPDALEDEAFFKEFARDGSLHTNEEGELINGIVEKNREDYLNHPHIVFDLSEMLRYIVFREKVFENEF